MSSLCKYSFITINKNDSSPTPTLRKTLNPCNDLLPVKFLQTANFIKRISLLILPRTPVKASMTVETALVLPLFCFFYDPYGKRYRNDAFAWKPGSSIVWMPADRWESMAEY